MREARYRVWDKKCRIYLEIVGAEVGGKNTKFCGFKYIYCRPQDPSFKMKNPLTMYGGCVGFKLTDGVDSNRLVFEQDTGLKDKNGESIWEGDIVEGTMGTFEVKWYNTASRFGFKSNMAMDWHPSFVRNQANKMEIVGNIHKNPELLKGGKMRLRNKKTGEIYYMYSESVDLGGKPQIILFPRGQVQPVKKAYRYDTLAELNEDWEDYRNDVGGTNVTNI